MSNCRNFGTSQVLVGLTRVGIAGLGEALKEAAESGLEKREAIVDRIIDLLEKNNYIHDRRSEPYRTALWREYLRSRGEDIRHLFSEIEVTVRGEAGETRDGFVKTLESVFAELELKPVITCVSAGGGGPAPELVIGGETIARGLQSRRALRLAVHRTISDW